MEVFMREVSLSATEHQLIQELAKVLHQPPFTPATAPLLNFDVHLFFFKDKYTRHHRGIGALTFPNVETGALFLSLYGPLGTQSLVVGQRKIHFKLSDKPVRRDVVETLARRPFIDPRVAQEKEQLDSALKSSHVYAKTIQFGLWCRDSVFSVEWEHTYVTDFSLSFDDDKREMRVSIPHETGQTYNIAIRFGQVAGILVGTDFSDQHVVTLTLETAPSFELACGTPRQRLSYLPFNDHERVVPYVSLAMRLVCRSEYDLLRFRKFADLVKLRYEAHSGYRVELRSLFSKEVMDQVKRWLRSLNWSVAFQVESILNDVSVDMKEILPLLPRIHQLVQETSKCYTADVLRHFAPQAKDYFWSHEAESLSLLDLFNTAEREYRDLSAKSSPLQPTDRSVFEAYHAIITPTGMRLEGPFLERSNRVIRRYDPSCHQYFLRVSFLEEGRLHFRFDRDIDATHFIRCRVGNILSNGLTIANRKFKFLAYSQSALKEHSVWFVTPFKDPHAGFVDAATIIKSLGTFDNLSFDPQLMHCPARYGARISQAFTATDASVTVQEVEEVFTKEDINSPGGAYCFTDGVGTISSELANEISKGLKLKKKRRWTNRARPRAFQVRFMGSKGMLSVDYRLQGRAICLRPSMIKFDAPDSREIEIARAFDRPGRYFLNRPLIMLLENLGVPYETFKEYQDDAVKAAWSALGSLEAAATVLEGHGLGTSFRLPGVMQSLQRLGLDNLWDMFHKNMMKYAVHHVLRELKNHARIPVPKGVTLVGVADIHKYLREGQVFACIKPVDGPTRYLEGPVLISRSPTIHPGDVQIAHAMGKPHENTCFAKEPLQNTLVFSVLGERPLPSCLGGGDLDGDEYNVIPLQELPEFKPKHTFIPATYAQAKRKVLDRPSTMQDVAEFVMEYINSDIVGIVAINWLIIADQSAKGIFDADCLKLSQLHSDAVDYPKSGNPVALDAIPRLHFKVRPDWNAPETINPDSTRYYESQRAIGLLFRNVDLPDIPRPTRKPKPRRSKIHRAEDLDEMFSHLSLEEEEIHEAIEARVAQFYARQVFHEGPPEEMLTASQATFDRYVSELTNICATCTISHARDGSLSEEEALVGTIIQKTSQPRKRKDAMSRLRESTDHLVRGVREELAGDEDEPLEDFLWRAWAAWLISLKNRKNFGGHSFGWVALGGVFEAIRQIETERMSTARRLGF